MKFRIALSSIGAAAVLIGACGSDENKPTAGVPRPASASENLHQPANHWGQMTPRERDAVARQCKQTGSASLPKIASEERRTAASDVPTPRLLQRPGEYLSVSPNETIGQGCVAVLDQLTRVDSTVRLSVDIQDSTATEDENTNTMIVQRETVVFVGTVEPSGTRVRVQRLGPRGQGGPPTRVGDPILVRTSGGRFRYRVTVTQTESGFDFIARKSGSKQSTDTWFVKRSADARPDGGQRATPASPTSLNAFRATNPYVRLLVRRRLGHGARSVRCVSRSTCTIAYNETGSTGLLGAILGTTDAADIERVYFTSMAKLFKTLFRDRQLQSATLVPYGVVTTPGGKEVRRPVMRMTCDRTADRQIDWDVIASTRPDGFKALCHYEQLVAFGRPSP